MPHVPQPETVENRLEITIYDPAAPTKQKGRSNIASRIQFGLEISQGRNEKEKRNADYAVKEATIVQHAKIPRYIFFIDHPSKSIKFYIQY